MSVSPDRLTVREGAGAMITAQANGAQKIYWIIRQDGEETLAAVDRLTFRFDAGRVAGDTSLSIGLKRAQNSGKLQRTLPRLYSNMGIMSTLGIRPPGTCHYPLAGWSAFAHMVQPLIERDLYGQAPTGSITPPDLKHAYFTSDAKDAIALEFDQPVIWKDALASEFYLDGQSGVVVSGVAAGNVLTLTLKQASTAGTITYLDSKSWRQDRLIDGANGIAALTFCEAPISAAKPPR